METPEAIVGAVRALIEYEASMADYVALARRITSSGSLKRLTADRAQLAGDRRRVRRELKAMLADYCGALKAEGMPPERMVIAIKELAAVALHPASDAPKQAKVLSKPCHLREIVAEVDRMIAA